MFEGKCEYVFRAIDEKLKNHGDCILAHQKFIGAIDRDGITQKQVCDDRFVSSKKDINALKESLKHVKKIQLLDIWKRLNKLEGKDGDYYVTTDTYGLHQKIGTAASLDRDRKNILSLDSRLTTIENSHALLNNDVKILKKSASIKTVEDDNALSWCKKDRRFLSDRINDVAKIAADAKELAQIKQNPANSTQSNMVQNMEILQRQVAVLTEKMSERSFRIDRLERKLEFKPHTSSHNIPRENLSAEQRLEFLENKYSMLRAFVEDKVKQYDDALESIYTQLTELDND